MQGTLEPIVKSLNELANEEVTVKILQASIGDISESDVMLAEASDAVIIGFSVGVDKAAAVRADQSGVEIRHYEVIYKMLEDIEDAMKGMLEPIYNEVVIGHAQVLQLFKLRKGFVAGCMVSDGVVSAARWPRYAVMPRRLSPVRVETLRRFTEDVAEVRQGYECGINLTQGDELLGKGRDRIERARPGTIERNHVIETANNGWLVCCSKKWHHACRRTGRPAHQPGYGDGCAREQRFAQRTYLRQPPGWGSPCGATCSGTA